MIRLVEDALTVFVFFYSKVLRKNVAQVLTVMNQTQKAALRKNFKNASLKPLDLRRKKTRAIRRRLTRSERGRKTTRGAKKIQHFPLRKFAVKS